MAITIYSAYGREFLPSGSSNPRQIRSFLTYEIEETDFKYKVTVLEAGIQMRGGDCTTQGGTLTLKATGFANQTARAGFAYQGATRKVLISNKVYEWSKNTQVQNNVVSAKYVVTSGMATGTYLCELAVDISALVSRTLMYNAGEGIIAPAPQTIYGESNLITVSDMVPVRPGYDFKGWSKLPSQGSGEIGGVFAFADDETVVTLYAAWHESYRPPVFDNVRAYRVASDASGINPPVLNSGTRVYFDCDYVPPRQLASATPTYQRLVLVGKNAAFTVFITTSKIYGYTSSGALPVTDKDTIMFELTFNDYMNIPHEYSLGTYITSERYNFDSFLGIREVNGESERYQSFAVGCAARNFNSEERSPNGDFDIAMNLTVGGIDYTISDEEYDELQTLLGAISS